MRDQIERINNFHKKFATDENTSNYLMKTTAVHERFNVPREKMLDNTSESYSSSARREEFKERMMLNQVEELIKLGYKPRKEETFENFISRCNIFILEEE